MTPTALWGLAFAHACALAQTNGYSAAEIYPGLSTLLKTRAEGETIHDWWLWNLVGQAARYCPHDLDTAMGPYSYDNRGDGHVFAQLHRDHIRYDHARSRWLIFDGARWAPDQIDRLREYAAQCAEFRIRQAGAIEDPAIQKAALRWARKGRHSGQVDYMLREARSIPPIADTGDGWDSNTYLLGVPNGVVDLRNGQLLPGAPEDRITLQTAVPYDPAATAPLWRDTLEQIFQDKPPGFVDYLQRALGYSISGSMDEEVFFLLVGTGRNGKGTVVDTVYKVLGSYADGLKFASLEASRNGTAGAAATPDLSKLDGKRFVIASEGSGTALNTALIKQITGRDPMTVRELYKAERTFMPMLKLWLTTQSDKRPRVRDDSDGFWARPHEIQFAQSFKDKADLGLKDRLYDQEAQGILAWLVQGAVAWHRNGLQAPTVVTQAVEEYRHSQEPLAEFYEARCTIDTGAAATSEELRGAYVDWCKATSRHFVLGPKRFSQEVAKRFGEAVRRTAGDRRWVYQGVGLAPHDPGPAPQEPGPSDRQPGDDNVQVPF